MKNQAHEEARTSPERSAPDRFLDLLGVLRALLVVQTAEVNRVDLHLHSVGLSNGRTVTAGLVTSIGNLLSKTQAFRSSIKIVADDKCINFSTYCTNHNFLGTNTFDLLFVASADSMSIFRSS